MVSLLKGNNMFAPKRGIVNTDTNSGVCPICEKETVFVKEADWLRDHYICKRCRSIPRQRALIIALNKFYPQWRNMIIHESSPCGQSSDYIKSRAEQYTYSQYFLEHKSGEYVEWDGLQVMCQNIEDMSFDNESIDIFITQDVIEHVFYPQKAFSEIGRVLKKGGIHIFTVPYYWNLEKSQCRATLMNETINFIEEPIYHGNPVDNNGALVTYDWGRDLVECIYRNSGLVTTIYLNENPERGLEAEFMEVFISVKQ